MALTDYPEYPCPLCGDTGTQLFHQDRLRDFLRCLNCSLVYVPSEYHLISADEKKRYDLHRNDPSDVGYRQFLNKLVSALAPLLPAGGRGLDYGSGPGPTLSKLFTDLDFSMQIFDPFYANDQTRLHDTYDFITCTETIEHFNNPKQEWELLLKLVRRRGWIGIMTSLLESPISFSSWYYKNDLTHICFYSQETFNWLAVKYDLEVHFHGTSVILVRT